MVCCVTQQLVVDYVCRLHGLDVHGDSIDSAFVYLNIDSFDCFYLSGTLVIPLVNNHARNEEFRGRRPSHLEQFTCRSANRNSLPCDVRSTF